MLLNQSHCCINMLKKRYSERTYNSCSSGTLNTHLCKTATRLVCTQSNKAQQDCLMNFMSCRHINGANSAESAKAKGTK
jgi:hypothetical protein